MAYYHWASNPVELTQRSYPQRGHPKPNGFWFDVDGSWKRWCESIEFRLETLCYRHTVTLLDESKILFLNKAEDIDEFTGEYGQDLSGNFQCLQSPEEMDEFSQKYGQNLFNEILGQFSNYIMWGDVAEKYTGIIIDPYLQEKSETYLWYHGLNCAGGCIWDTDVIRLGKAYGIAR